MGSRALILVVLALLPVGCGSRDTPGEQPPATASSWPDTAPPKRVDPHREGQPNATADLWSSWRRIHSWPFARVADPADVAEARKRPFGIDALYSVKQVSSPQWSPDAKRILFTVTSYDLRKATSNGEIWMVDGDGGNLRQMTRFEGSDAQAKWAPDSKSFLFVSSRSHGEQVWVMPVDGGEPRQVSSTSTGVSDPIWSPDGKRIAFASRVFPEAGADDAKNKSIQSDIDGATVRAHIADHLLFRHWSFYTAGTRNHVLVLDVESGHTIDVTPGDFDSPSFELGSVGFAFSPDGDEICFVSNREEPDARAWTTNKDLWAVPSNGGAAVQVTTNPAYDGHPGYSPDGRYIAYLRQEKPGFESDRFRLALHDRRMGTTRVLTEGLDTWVLDFSWSADSKSIVFSAPVHGRFLLFRLDVATSAIEPVGTVPSVESFDVASDGRIAFTYSAVGDPVELYVSGATPTDSKRLTSFNRALLETHDVRPVEELWIDGADGKKVHTFVVKPHGFRKGKKYPVVLNVHGGPQYQWADRFRGDWQVYPAAGYVVVFPNPHGSIGYGQEYTDAISKDWGGKVFDDVMRVADAVAQLDYVDGERMGAMGWSYGGYFMNLLIGRTQRFKAAASMMGIFDLRSWYGSTEELWFPEWDLGGSPWQQPDAYSQLSPSRLASHMRTPTLIITGEKDYRIPYTQSLQLFTALRRHGVPARIVVFPDDGHWPSHVKAMPLYYAAHLDWFHRYLGGEPAPYDPMRIARGTAFK